MSTGALTLAQVVAGRLARCRRVAKDPEEVIAKLEGDTEGQAEGAQRRRAGPRSAAGSASADRQRNYECHCGKYKRIRYKGIVCDRCGVEVTEKKVRRERMGHISLVVPVAHIWYFRSLPNKIGYLLGLPTKKLDSIIYYERYVVINPGIKAVDGVKYLDFLTEEEYLEISESLPKENQYLDDTDPNKFIANMGAEAFISFSAVSISMKCHIHFVIKQIPKLHSNVKMKL